MAIEVEKSNLIINQIIANKNELATVEGDCIVPDVKPDIMNIIGTSGIVSIYKKEVSEGRIRIDGCVSVYVMYNGNDGENNSIRSINHVLDFSQIIAVPEAKSDMIDLGSVNLQNIDCKMVNERKINIKANMNFEVKLSASTSVEYISNINVSDLQKKDSKVNVSSVVGIGNTKTSVSENMTIDGTDNLAEILKVTTCIKNVDTKVSYNKVLIKSDVNLKILYSTEDGRFNMTESTFPIMGFVDMKDVSEDDVINPTIEIKNMVIKPNGSQDHSITVDIEVGIGLIIYSNKEINVVKDMYSPSTNLSFTQKSVQTLQNTQVINSTMSFNQKELLDIGDEKVYDVDAQVIATDVKANNNSIDISGNIRFNFIHSTNKMTGIDNKKIDVPFEHRIACENVKPKATIKLITNINNDNFNIMPGGEVELRMDVNFRAETSNFADINLIDSVEEKDNNTSTRYNMVIYYTKQNDDLWQIAKKFRSTKEAIQKENNLENTTLQPGTQLFITRYTR